MNRYRSSDIVPLSGLRALTIMMLAVGIIGGVAVAIIGQYFYFIFLFPLLMATAIAFALNTVVAREKIRSPLVALVFGAMTGCLMYTSYHVASYFLFRNTVVEKAVAKYGLDRGRADNAIDILLEQKTGNSGFIGYLDYIAQTGLTFMPAMSGLSNDSADKTLIVGETVYLYWIGEAAAIICFSAWMAWRAAQRPYCENCDAWYKGRGVLGYVERKQMRRFVMLLKRGEFSDAKGLFAAFQRPPRVFLEVECQYCQTCQTGPLILTASRRRRNSRSRSIWARGTVSVEQFKTLSPINSTQSAAAARL